MCREVGVDPGEGEARLVSGFWPAWRRSGQSGAEWCLGPNQALEAQSKTETEKWAGT